MKHLKWAVLALNPCIDHNCYLDSPIKQGSINRIIKTSISYAGKGLNQAIVASRLGQTVSYYSFCGQGQNRSQAEEIGEREAFKVFETRSNAGIRTNIKVIDSIGSGTEFNEKGGPYTEEEAAALIHSFLNSDADIYSMAGSIPQGLAPNTYAEIISKIKREKPGAIILLDADREALALGIQASPTLIKPNLRELAGLAGVSESELQGRNRLKEVCSDIFRKYHSNVICTLDAQGAAYYGEGGQFLADAPKVSLRGFSGAGDTFLTAFCFSRFAENAQIPEAMNYASRAAGAKVALEGTALPASEDIQQIPTVAVREW